MSAEWFAVLATVGIFIIYLPIDFLIVEKGNNNKFIEKWLKKTLWLWLPIHAFYRLTKEMIFRRK